MTETINANIGFQLLRNSAFVPSAPAFQKKTFKYDSLTREQTGRLTTKLKILDDESSRNQGHEFAKDVRNEVHLYLHLGSDKTNYDPYDKYIIPRNYPPQKKNGAIIALLSALLIFGNFAEGGSQATASTANIPNDAFGANKMAYTYMVPQLSTSSITSDTLFQSLSANLMQRSETRSPAATQNRWQRYWDAQEKGTIEERALANEKLIDGAVSTINTMYYDSSGGSNFDPREFYSKWKEFRLANRDNLIGITDKKDPSIKDNAFATRENAAKALKNLVSSLNDPYSKYLTREELREELEERNDGFLGLGAIVEVPPLPTASYDPMQKRPLPLSRTKAKDINSIFTLDKIASRGWYGQWDKLPAVAHKFTDSFKYPVKNAREVFSSNQSNNDVLTLKEASNLPIVKAIVPDSPAERAGIVVGDRIASVGSFHFTGMTRSQVKSTLDSKFHASSYFGRADLTIAKPIVARIDLNDAGSKFDGNGNFVQEQYVFEDGWYRPNSRRASTNQIAPIEQVLGYKLSRVKSIPTTLTAGPFHQEDVEVDSLQRSVSSPGATVDLYTLDSADQYQPRKNPSLIGGDAIVHYELLTPKDSIFQRITGNPSQPVGYIRLTRFSKTSTAGYINAINQLEDAGAKSYILDLRNNYGGVIQEAMLTASTLLRDPHSVLCYTLNSRGGFRPQENMEYIVDKRYPGYLLSSEPSNVSRDQVKREHPEYLEDGGWSSPTSYASLNELKVTRGIKLAHAATLDYWKTTGETMTGDAGLQRSIADSASIPDKRAVDLDKMADAIARGSQKKLVILINEGTASSAEVFASALHDNGRTVALVGTKSFGKGLIQHTFPMPDGGGLRLTVSEYLTPLLHHVTKVGSAKFDSGIQPDIRCDSRQGIPKNVGADLCVGVALDVLESAANGG